MLIKANTSPKTVQVLKQRPFRTSLSTRLNGKWAYLRGQQGFRNAPLTTLVRLAFWRVMSLLHWSRTIMLRRWNGLMFLPGHWRGIGKLLFVFREHYEPELAYLEQILSPGKIFVDVGACYGIYTLAASRIVGEQGQVLAFEPALRAFNVLQKNIAMNCLTNTIAYPLALTEQRGTARLFRHPNVGCDSLGRDETFTEITEDIATASLDNVLREKAIEHVEAIKIDVQGAEELVLRGAIKILSKSHPTVIFEVYPPCAPPLGLAPYGAWEFLQRLGYKFFVVDQNGVLQRQQAAPTDRNVVAIYEQALKTPDADASTSSETAGSET